MEKGHNSGGSDPAQAGEKVPLERIARPESQPGRYLAGKHGIFQPVEGREGTADQWGVGCGLSPPTASPIGTVGQTLRPILKGDKLPAWSGSQASWTVTASALPHSLPLRKPSRVASRSDIYPGIFA